VLAIALFTAARASGSPLNAVEVVSSTLSGASATCSGPPPNTGLAYSGTPVFGPDPAQDWRYVLALLYGGLDITTNVTDCNQTARKNLVANWSLLFQDACAPAPAVCTDATHNGVLWHAFRVDDDSESSVVFASLIGLSPAPSATANFGFGTSPYCNAMNWDSSSANRAGTGCGLGLHDQLTGPGGVVDPLSACNGTTCGAAGSGNHRKPPPGTWGENPLGIASAKAAWDVLPTEMQDNDPIRRPCLGGKTNNHNIPGEEVCNLDDALGMVLPITETSWIVGQQYPVPGGGLGPPLVAFPNNLCNSFGAARAPRVMNCPINRAAVHDGECPNGDSETGGACIVPIDAVSNRSDCVATKATIPALVQRATLGSSFGRAYNLHMLDGTMPTNGALIGYAQHPVTTGSTTTFDFAGAYNRIHEVEAVDVTLLGCQQPVGTNQVGCLVQADPCSLGYAGDNARFWSATPGNGAVPVSQIFPTATTVASGAYPLSCVPLGVTCN
jgi:hypothetical protein